MDEPWDDKFSFYRLWAIIIKEFVQIRRDRPTLVMMIGIPLMQLMLFGFAINTNPKHLPTALVSADQSIYTRDFLKAMENTEYFRFINSPMSQSDADKLLAEGKVEFIISIPQNFSRKLIRGEKPQLLLEVDATDPAVAANAVGAFNTLAQTSFDKDLSGVVANLKSTSPSVNVITHLKYNPLIITQYNIVPGLLGVILALTMVNITALAMTRERERGTLENLLATPVRPVEVMIGKITPYIIIGYIQACLILSLAYYIFNVPIEGSIVLLLLICLPFIAANLSMGLTFSTLAKNQLQAVMSSVFFFLPSLLLSGFMFPFYGMPVWAQWLGEILPLTHFIRITRGILLKGNDFMTVWPQIWPIILFAVVVVAIGVKRFRQTLD